MARCSWTLGGMGNLVLCGVLRLSSVGAGAFPHSPFMLIPTHFSWSLFGLALLCLFGLNGPLLLDGEMYGGHRFLRGSPAFLWWGALGSFLLLLVITLAWIVLAPNTQA